MIDNMYSLILHSVSKHNILPITSRCNVSCVFCSHKQNPPGLKVVAMAPISKSDFLELLDFIDEDKKIIIGESATQIIEGEPFTHPDFIELMRLIRSRFPKTLLQITSNGSFFTEETVKELVELEPLEINLSLNFASKEHRGLLMKDKQAEIAVNSPLLLQKYKIAFHGSIVAMPWITTWQNLEQTILHLANNGAETIRVFEPGFTKYTQSKLKPPENWQQNLRQRISRIRLITSVPLTLEPPDIEDLTVKILGVIPNSKAAKMDLRAGDIIKTINGQEPFSRIEAFRTIEKQGLHKLDILRENNSFTVEFRQKKGDKIGFVMDCDISRDFYQNIAREIIRYKSKNPLIMASLFGYKIIKVGLKDIWKEAVTPTIVPVPSHFFGGTIQSAGLLVVEDFINAFVRHIKESQIKYDLLLIPAIAFDPQGKDLMGKRISEIEEEIGLNVVAI